MLKGICFLSVLSKEFWAISLGFVRYCRHDHLKESGTAKDSPSPEAVPADREWVPAAVLLVRFDQFTGAVRAGGKIEPADSIPECRIFWLLPDVSEGAARKAPEGAGTNRLFTSHDVAGVRV